MSIDAVVFDLFGTLVPPFSRPGHRRLTYDMAALLAVPDAAFDSAWTGAYPERGTGAASPADQIVKICEELGGSRPDEPTVRAVMELRFAFFRRTLVPRSGVVAVLEALRSRGRKLGVVSDCSGEAPSVWRDTSLAPLVDAAAFSCEVGCHKPDPKIYRVATDSLDVRGDQCLYVGDGGSRELSGARDVGMQAVLLRVPEEQDAEAYLLDEREVWPGPTISSLDEVLALC
jgi:putative hydrolase of the HAD superfamily